MEIQVCVDTPYEEGDWEGWDTDTADEQGHLPGNN